MEEWTMKVNNRKPLLEKDGVNHASNTRTRHPSQKKKCHRSKAVWCFASLFLGILFHVAIYLLVTRYIFAKAVFDVELTEAKKCPACAGQSACPSFFRGEVSMPAFRYKYLTGGVQPSSFGLEATLGLYETAHAVNIRRIGTPAAPEVVDASVCRRGLPHGYEQATELERTRLRCIPHLAIWRWLPTTEADGVSVDAPLHRGLVAAPVFYTTPNLTEEAWTQRVMPTAFAPATRCSSDRLFKHLLSSFRERTSLGAETRLLRFDELMFLFNLAVDPQPIIWQGFPRTAQWPFPSYQGACGRWTMQDFHGVPLANFCTAPLWMRLRILSSILDIPDKLQRHTARHDNLDPTDGYTVYLGNPHLATLFTVDPETYNVTIANLRHAIIVDTYAIAEHATTSEFVVPVEATDLVISNLPCLGNASSSGDAGGTTPPCLSRDHADQLCSHSDSDHNHWLVCTALLHGWTASEACAGFLSDMPVELMNSLRRCVADTRSHARRGDLLEAKRIVSRLIDQYPEPFIW